MDMRQLLKLPQTLVGIAVLILTQFLGWGLPMVIPSTTYNGILIIIIGVAISIPLFIWAYKSYRHQRSIQHSLSFEQEEQAKENYQLIRSIPTLITDIDKRRAELIQAELDKKMHSSDTQFVFNMLKDAWCILLGTEPPTLPTRTGNEDIGSIIDILVKYTTDAETGIKKMQERTKELGDLETGLLIARVVNKYLGIDDELAKNPMNERLKLARELLPSPVAVETTKSINNYLDYSRAYRAIDASTIPLAKMIEANDFLENIPIMKQVIDKFQQYKEKYLKEMNINQAKVNEALKLL